MNKKQQGFTLIELSIVLIIIGLLVGGVLVGQDLIEGARIRSQINQINNYDTALNTFQLKYNATPGDCSNCNDTGYNLRTSCTTTDCDEFAGDGDGTIEGDLSGTQVTGAGFEASYVFVDLGGAGLVDGVYDDEELPDAAINTGAIALVGGAAGTNYFIIGAISGTGTASGSNTVCDTGACPTPLMAYTLDSKMDDGVATSGNVGTVTYNTDITTGSTWTAATGHANCHTTGTYDVSDDSSADCPLKVRTSL